MNQTIPLNIYYTTDFALATVLATIGIEFADQNCRCTNFYDPAFLQKMGRTAEQCVDQGIPGKIQWMFKYTPDLEAAVQTFYQIVKTPDAQKVVDVPDVSIPDTVKIMAMFAKNRAQMAADFKHQRPKVAITRGPNGEMTIVDKNTSPEALAQWGLTK